MTRRGWAAALDRYAARCVNFLLVVPRIAVLAARSAARDTGNQPRGSARISRGGAPWLVCAVSFVAAPAAGQTVTAPAGARQLVIPFENASKAPRAHWLTEASAVILTDDLRALGAAAIVRDDRLRAFDRLRVPPVATLSHATVIRLGQIVGAAHVVLGSVELDGDTLIVRARTIRLDVGRMSAEMVERGPLTDLFGVYARIARRIVPESPVTLDQMEQDHPSPAAFEQYIKGLLAEMPATRVTYLSEALRLAAPTFQRPRIALWQVRHDQGEHREALAVVEALPSDHRLSRQARFLATVSLISLGRFDEAFARLGELNASGPDPSLLNNLGVAQLRRSPSAPGGRPFSYFVQAVRLDPGDPDIYFNLGYAHWLDRDLAPAVAWLKEAVRRNPADAVAHYVLGVALQSSGSAAEGMRERDLAKRLSSEIVELEARQAAPNTLPSGLERVKTELDVPTSLRLEAAIAAAGQRDQHELASFHLESGRRFFQSDRDREAISELRRAVFLAPYQSEAHLLLGRLYLRGGRLAEAVDALKISIWSDDSLAAHVALAETYLAAKDGEAARAELQHVLGRDAGHAEARRLLGTLPAQGK